MLRGIAPTARHALVIGVGGVVAITLACDAVPGQVPAEIPALLLLLPITAASVLADWHVGVPVAVLAGVAHALLFIPPRGVLSLGYTRDVTTLATFCLVALTVSVLVSRRSIRDHADLIGTQRMLLLRGLAHDIRSPLHVILSASSELRDGADHDLTVRRRLLGLVIDETRRLDRIVDNVLNLGRLQAGALVPSLDATDLRELVEESTRRLRRHVGEADRIVVGELPDVDVRVDAVQIDQVLCNLVENAVRHGGSPATVTIGAAADGPVVRITVDDEGVGFSDVARTRLFHPFTSTDDSSGLGLTVCKAIVEAHGGTMAVTSGARGGTSISFTVPRAG